MRPGGKNRILTKLKKWHHNSYAKLVVLTCLLGTGTQLLKYVRQVNQLYKLFLLEQFEGAILWLLIHL